MRFHFVMLSIYLIGENRIIRIGRIVAAIFRSYSDYFTHNRLPPAVQLLIEQELLVGLYRHYHTQNAYRSH